uniref:Uncharacterized protein n=1 Tax=Cyclophora tenuis TaxID=216820 RepID=A0A7S1D026_CYCTE|mmetsp:Transcript_1404/g.2450  ORF Transcript_1404/g.2450 Transcript_1404/m.2450 type:complete len:193 (+) Transcript_1404:2-580(+)
MALQPSFVEYLVTSLKRPDSLPTRFKENLIRSYRLMTDETFIPTLAMHVHPFNETLPNVNEDGTLVEKPDMETLRFERMDEHVPTAFGYFPEQQRYEVPESSLADQPKPWGPYFLGAYDLASIKASGALFVRKVSVHVDPNIVHLLPVSSIDDLPSIGWPKEVRISEVPDWEKTLQELKAKQGQQDSDDQDL